MTYGGKRIGAGRKKESPSIEVIAQELVFPALCQAFRSQPDKWGNRLLTVELSKTDIKRAYGNDGLSCWINYFKLDKVGGRDRNGVGYKSRWVLKLGSYDIVLLLVESLGHTIKDIPNPGFPPKALLDRLQAKDDKIKAKKQKQVENAAEV